MIAVEPFTPIRAVAKGSADLGLTFHFRSPLRKGIAILGQIQCPMHVVMTPDHELATRSSVTLEECGGYPLIYQEDSGSMGVFFGQEMQNFKELHQPVSISNNLGLMKQLLIGGKGIAFYTRLGFVEELASAARAPHLVAGLQARCLENQCLTGPLGSHRTTDGAADRSMSGPSNAESKGLAPANRS